MEYLDAQMEGYRCRFRDNAILLNGQAMQIVADFAASMDKRAKRLGLEKLYPELFGKKKIDTSHMTPSQIKQAQVAAWRAFLGV